MTLADVKSEGYEVDDHGIIRAPGKFEAEPWQILHYWFLAIDGFASCAAGKDDSESDEWADLFIADESDVALLRPVFSEIKIGTSIWLCHSDQGFCSLRVAYRI